jgi:putative mRNA 3-end processing factor
VRLVSHAHSDHLYHLSTSLRECRTVLATPLTRDFIGILQGRRKAGRIRALPYGESFTWEGERLELHPAAHIPGSAQALLTTADGVRIAYTGDFRAPPAPVLRAEVLVTEATYGEPGHVRAFRDRVEPCFLELVRERLKHGPVCVVGFHGKLQEAVEMLNRGGIEEPIVAPDRVYELLEVCRAHGLPHRNFHKQGSPEGEEAGRGPHVRLQHTAAGGGGNGLPRIMLTGWEFEEPCRRLAGGSYRVALSDHADFSELLAYVEASGARLVIADGFRSQGAPAFAREVERRLGVRALALP